MSKFELHPVDPAFKAMTEATEKDAQEFSARVMDAMAQLMDKAIKRALEHVTAADLTVSVDPAGDLYLVLDGTPVFGARANLLDVDVTVDGAWLDWDAVVKFASNKCMGCKEGWPLVNATTHLVKPALRTHSGDTSACTNAGN